MGCTREGVGARRPMSDDIRVSTIELFFDLVFVFTITQLTMVLVAEPTGVGVARAALIFGNVWWMYGGYAWLTNAVPPDAPVVRLLMLVGMAGFLVIALAIPHAFGGSAVAFGVGYLIVTLVHTGLFLQSTEGSVVRAMSRLGPFNTITAALLLGAAFTHGPWRWTLWIAAFVLHWGSPAITAVGGFRIRAAHFVERHGLILLIALGESVVAIGVGVQRRALTAGVLVTSVLALALAAAMWWLFFAGEDTAAERALDDASASRNPWLSLFAFGYAFLPVLGGVIAVAAGVKQAMLVYGKPASAPTAWFLGAGLAVYVAGLVAIRLILRTGPATVRLAVAAVALLTVAIGRAVSSEAQLAALTVVLVAGIATEALGTRRVGAVR
jgi:low temperature requirement protein LtrA